LFVSWRLYYSSKGAFVEMKSFCFDLLPPLQLLRPHLGEDLELFRPFIQKTASDNILILISISSGEWIHHHGQKGLTDSSVTVSDQESTYISNCSFV
jgi:hypothetical protein